MIVRQADRKSTLASDIASIVQEEVFSVLKSSIKILAGKNTPIPYNHGLGKICVPQEDDIVNAVREINNAA